MVQVENLTERSKEQITPGGGDKNVRIVKFQYLDIAIML
jgi:hypothetical protein